MSIRNHFAENQIETLEKVDVMGPETFKSQFFLKEKPIVLKNFASDWPAIKKWTPDFFKNSYGDQEVKVYSHEFGTPGETYMSPIKMMTMRDYLSAILDGNKPWRIFLNNLAAKCPNLKSDVGLRHWSLKFSKRFLFLFFGPKNSETQLHYDIDMSHVFHTVLWGRKRFVIFAPDQSKNLYRHPFTVRSYVDLNKPDFQNYPKLQDLKGYEVVLEPGETLFMPAGYWHHVTYEEAGYGISLRHPHQKLSKRLLGFYNIGFVQVFDRLVNRMLPRAWFQWKEKQARRLAGFQA